MSLVLSSAAAPERALPALDQAARARGLDGLEWVLEAEQPLEAFAVGVQTSGARVAALRAEALPQHLDALAHLAATLGVPVSAPAAALPSGALAAAASAFERAGGTLLLGEGAALEPMAALAQALRAAGTPRSVGVALELRPSTESLREASAALFACRPFLGLVRLHGGGPEQRAQDGLGVGGVLADLAACDFAGPTVLTPSGPAALPQWRSWLDSKRSAGCGSAHPPRALALELDMRPVEPRDRLDTILGAYHALARGGTLRLTVDHDPSCMAYTLEATEPEGSFSFHKVLASRGDSEDGPVVWRAEVTRL